MTTDYKIEHLGTFLYTGSKEGDILYKYSNSNYVPLYCINLLSFIPTYRQYTFETRIKLDEIRRRIDNNNLTKYFLYKIGEYILQNYTEKSPEYISKEEFKRYIKDNTEFGKISKYIIDDITKWIDSPINISQNLSNHIYSQVKIRSFPDRFFSYNSFTRVNYLNLFNYGFYGEISGKGKVVLMVKKENIQFTRKCFLTYSPIPKEMLELWVSPNLTSYEKKLVKSLNKLYNFNTFIYPMEGIMSSIVLPSVKSIEEKRKFEKNIWKEFIEEQSMVEQ